MASVASYSVFQANPTLATGDVKVSIDGGALANLATLPVVTPAASKLVKVSLSAAEMNGDNIAVIFSDVAGAEWQDLTVVLQTVTNQLDDLMTAAAGTTLQADTDDIQARLPAALVSGRMDSSVGAMASNVLTATAIATDAITAAKIAADAIGASELAADAVAEIQSGLATPTNITAGTITTVTNLTNAPTNGDLTATMKTSVTTAATAATPTASAVTGNVGGNVVGSVGSVIAGVTLAAAAVTAIWDKLTSALTTAGSVGKLIADNLDAAVSSRATQTSVDTVDDFLDTEIAAIKAKTDNLPAAPAAVSDIPSAASVASAVLASVLEGALTVAQAWRIMLGVMAGKSSGGGTTSIKFRDMADSKDRISATVDSNGNRTAVTRDGT